MSDSVRPHRQQPIKLLCPWNSPGKNTGVGCHFLFRCMHAKLLQSCLTLCNPMDSSPPDSPVHRILQARILEWVAISFSNACMHAKLLQSCLTLRPYGQQPTRLPCPQDSPGKNTAVGCHFLLPYTCRSSMNAIFIIISK